MNPFAKAVPDHMGAHRAKSNIGHPHDFSAALINFLGLFDKLHGNLERPLGVDGTHQFINGVDVAALDRTLNDLPQLIGRWQGRAIMVSSW